MNNYETIQVDIYGYTQVLTFNRPEALNAINGLMLDEIDDFISSIDYGNVKGIILTGSGEKAFAAGADISELQKDAVQPQNKFAEKGLEVFSKIEKLPIPAIASINGYALGGGLELALACHFRFAAEDAKFGQPEVNLAILPGYGGTVRLRETIGHSNAFEMIISGRIIEAAEALRLGLINKMFPKENLLQASINFIESLYKKPKSSVNVIIKHFQNMQSINRESLFELETEAFYKLTESEEFIAATSEFLRKKK